MARKIRIPAKIKAVNINNEKTLIKKALGPGSRERSKEIFSMGYLS